MKALVTTAYGDVDKLTVADVPEPQIGPGDVKVQVQAASINPMDWKLLSGEARTVMELHFPAILGRDVSGDVLEVGSDVNGLRPGDHVLGLASSTFAEDVVAAENVWAKAPTGLDPLAAAALPLVTLTGAQLADAVAPRPGLSILVTGAVGGVGRSAVFVAKAAGAVVWAGVRTQQKEAARLLGADHIVAIDDDQEIAGLPAFDAICDTVGGETIVKLLSRLKPGGVLGSVLGEPPAAKERGVKTNAIRVQPDPARLAQLAQAAAEKRLVVPVERTFPIEQAAEAFRLARSGIVGKVLLRP
jgi:NADPH:quinone reductase-like Zn-dependent oxidoreductase